MGLGVAALDGDELADTARVGCDPIATLLQLADAPGRGRLGVQTSATGPGRAELGASGLIQQRVHLGGVEPPVPAERADRLEATRPSPAGDRLRVHAEHRGYF